MLWQDGIHPARPLAPAPTQTGFSLVTHDATLTVYMPFKLLPKEARALVSNGILMSCPSHISGRTYGATIRCDLQIDYMFYIVTFFPDACGYIPCFLICRL